MKALFLRPLALLLTLYGSCTLCYGQRTDSPNATPKWLAAEGPSLRSKPILQPVKRRALEYSTTNASQRTAVRPDAPAKEKARKAAAVSALSNGKTKVLPGCLDSSFRKQLLSANRIDYAFTTYKTRDGGALIGGGGRDTLQTKTKWYGVLIKLNAAGEISWAHEYQGKVKYELDLQEIYEMSDGSLIIAGDYENELFQGPDKRYYDALVMKLSPTGDLIWSKTFHSTQTVCSNSTNIYIRSIAEGLNGDILLGGTTINCSSPTYEVAMKLNAAGVLQWSQSYSHYFSGYGFGIYYHNNEVVLVSKNDGNFSGSDGSVKLNFMRMNYQTGDTLGQHRWRLDGPTWGPNDHVFINNISSRRLANGHFVIYGLVFGDTDWPIRDTTTHFSVVEFDAAFRYVGGYVIKSLLKSDSDYDNIHVDEQGRAQFMVFRYLTGRGIDLFFGSVSADRQYLNQRRIAYPNVDMAEYSGFVSYDNGSYAHLQTQYTTGSRHYYMDYVHMNNSDTSSVCLGTDTAFSHIAAVHYVPVPWPELSKVIDTTVYETPNTVTVHPLVYTAAYGCSQTNSCDSLKLRPLAPICNGSQEVLIQAYKNKECGAWVNWEMDTTAIQSLQQVSDSVVRIRFKENNWSGYLKGFLPGRCGMASDSILLTVMKPAGAVNLGPDVLLCSNNRLLLNAKKGYATYRWQDGSTDSTFTVTLPGRYYVTTTDACGGTFSDTVVVTAAPPIPFDAGPDRVKCNNDTLHLTAPSGFLRYTWSNHYAISAPGARSVVVNPAVDTAYYIAAEKSPGCFAYDTIRIRVYHSPAIDLGADLSFCHGEWRVLDAGAGFSSYLWNGAIPGQQYKVAAKGTYTVMGTTAEGCRAYDTLQVHNVWPPPVLSLDKNAALCTGSTRTLNPGPFSSYLWQDGSTAATYTATGTGKYWVRVTDSHNCVSGDTVNITTILPLPSQFLPPDTTLCSYSKMELKPQQPYSLYLWSDGSSTRRVMIDKPGTYWLEVTDTNHCKGRDSVVVFSKDCLQGLYVPTAFTPNGDGKNDVLKALLFGPIRSYTFTVYNRWGEVVYTTTDPDSGWNGHVRGKRPDTGVYAWMCTYQLEGGEKQTAKGTVTLVQ